MNNENTVINGNDNEPFKDQGLKFKGSRKARVGKIARLPLAIRQQLNQRLQNGEQGKLLVQWLNGLPEVQAILSAQFNGQPISEPNLTAWRQGGYRDWEEEQRTLLAVSTVFEHAAELKEAGSEALAENLALVLTAKLATEVQRLNDLPPGEERTKVWKELAHGLVLLRRGNLQGERVKVEREKLAFRQERHQKVRDEEIWQWVQKEQNRDKILERLLTPKQLEEEQERWNERERNRVREILGLPLKPIPALVPVQANCG